MNARTARRDKSIWQPPLTEDAFRDRLITLSRNCKQVPRDPVNGQISGEAVKDNPLLLFESILAKAFAYIAANTEGVNAVSAACVENVQSTGSVTIRIAANDGVRAEVEQHLQSIVARLTFFAMNGKATKGKKMILFIYY